MKNLSWSEADTTRRPKSWLPRTNPDLSGREKNLNQGLPDFEVLNMKLLIVFFYLLHTLVPILALLRLLTLLTTPKHILTSLIILSLIQYDNSVTYNSKAFSTSITYNTIRSLTLLTIYYCLHYSQYSTITHVAYNTY